MIRTKPRYRASVNAKTVNAPVAASENQIINRSARSGTIRSSALVTMLPPSSGRIGTRLNNPMIGPAHQIARSAGSLE
jgi:hypothetical protein